MADHKGDNKHKIGRIFSSLLIDNQLTTSAKQISNHFNNFFPSIADKINRNIVKAKKPHLSYVAPETKNKFSFSSST